MKIDKGQIIDTVDVLIETQEELERRGMHPGAVLVVIGCALGTMLGASR